MSKSISVRRPGRRPAALLSVVAMAATGAIVAAVPAGAAVTQAGGLRADGLPTQFRDAQGVALVPCDVAASCGGVGLDPADATYFGSDSQVGPIRATYSVTAGVDPVDGLVVGQLSRFKGAGLTPGRYTIKDPWGTVSACSADAGGKMDCRVAANRISAFLHGDRGGAGFIGDGATAGPVTGSPTGFNRILITGPGGFRASRSGFILTGQMPANTAMSSVGSKAVALGSITKARPSAATIRYSSFGSANAVPRVAKTGANPGAFAVTNTCGSVAPGAACNIRVSYTPKANKNVSAVLTISDNGLAAARRVTLTGTGPDTRAPKVAASNPTGGATGVGPAKSVRVAFSEKVNGVRGNLTLVNNSTGRTVAAKLSKVGASRYVLNPRKALDRGTRYSVKVNGGRTAIRDLAGNAARDTQLQFRTR